MRFESVIFGGILLATSSVYALALFSMATNESWNLFLSSSLDTNANNPMLNAPSKKKVIDFFMIDSFRFDLWKYEKDSRFLLS